jgi:hypothetical protein
VRERNLVVTMGGPKLVALEPEVVGIGDTLTIHGAGLFRATTRIHLGDATPIDLSGVGAPTLRDDRVQITVPNDLALLPGTQVVQVSVGLDESNSLTTHTFPQTLRSNALSLVLTPKITLLAPLAAPAGTPHVLTLTGHRLYRTEEEANIALLIANQTIPASQFLTKSDTEIRVEVPNLRAGTYPVHLRFDASVSQDDIVFEVT